MDQQAWDSHPVSVTRKVASWGIQVETIQYIYQMWGKQDVNPGAHFRILNFGNQFQQEIGSLFQEEQIMLPSYMHLSPPYLSGGHLSKLPRLMIVANQWATFSPWGAGFTPSYYALLFLAPHKLTLISLVTYPPPAVMP
jgi:hypothetical protein